MSKKRWITTVTKEAAKIEVQMPWTRGATRVATIARREAKIPVLRAANG
jgi:hypothetical protein